MTPPKGYSSLHSFNIEDSSFQIDANQESESQYFIDPESYVKAEHKARWYINEIVSISNSETYLQSLSEDYSEWARSTQSPSKKHRISELEGFLQSDSGMSSLSFLQKLSFDNQLNDYLHKSIAYLFMRDLGKSLTDRQTDKTIKSIVSKIQRWVRKQPSDSSSDMFDNGLINRKAQEFGVTGTVSWLKSKLATLQESMPSELDKTNGLRKLVKIIAGVVLHQFVDMPKDLPKAEIAKRLDFAIRLGYSYGLTYPFVDDLQDSANALSSKDKEKFNLAIRESLLTGSVVKFPEISQENCIKMQFVYKELKEAFEFIRSSQSEREAKQFFQQAFVFFEAQDIDRQRKLTDRTYSDESLFLPIILKSAGCRLIAKEIINQDTDETFDFRTFCFGIYNQFNDDIKDIFDDLEEGNVTPYSYQLFQQGSNSNKAYCNTITNINNNNTNPYRIYWAVVHYLIVVVYQNEPRTKKLFLERSINAHKSLRNSIGEEMYQRLEKVLLTTGNADFDQQISALVNSPNDIAWFDKLISREVASFFKKQEQKKGTFKEAYMKTQAFIESNLSISNHRRVGKTLLAEAANYSLEAGGKRFRSVLAMNALCNRYQFTQEESIPVLQLLEYMHTASLVFDDKPSQDNADTRRGKPALHVHCNSEAKAELAGVYLMMKAVEVQASMKSVSAERVLQSLEYAANTTQAICEGQLLDLQSKKHKTDLAQLEKLCFLKTGLAIEAAIMIPAILGGENDIEKEHLKKFAKYLGIAFQVKDDLLDVEGNKETIGKPISQDQNARKASFVTLLGKEAAQERLYFYYEKANASLASLKNKADFYEQALDLVVYRNC